MKKNSKHLKIAAWATILIVILGTLYFMYEMKQNAYMETDLDEYMPKEHPAFVYSDQAEEWFNIKDGILIAIENQNGIYNPVTLQKIKDITIGLQEMDEFEDNDVMSFFSADNITGTEDGMDVREFYSDVPVTDDKLYNLRMNVKGNDMVAGRLVSDDETVALIVAGMNDSTFNEDFYAKILEFAVSFEDENNHVYVAGRPIVEGTMAQLGPEDMKRMVPIVILIIVIVLFILLRSVRATTATLISVSISTVWAFGLMAASGVPIYSVSTMIPVMLIAIGVAYGIYFYNHINRFYLEHQNASRQEAVIHTFKVLWKPLAMAAFTTIIGFISLMTSQVFPIKYFGLFTGFGILTAFILSMTFLPATIILAGYRPKNKKAAEGKVTYTRLNYITDKLLKRKKLIYAIVALIIAISVFGIQKVWINSSFLDKFEKDSDIVLTDAFVNSKFGGTSTLNIILESKQLDAFKQPQILNLIDQMQIDAEKLTEVGNSFSLADYLKRMNKVMNADNDAFYKIPETGDMIAQYLLLYEMSGDPENLAKVTNYDYNKTNITFQLKGDDTKTINKAMDVVHSYEKSLKEQGVEIKFAGSGYKELVFSDLILEGQIMSIIMSLILVLILLMVMFRSVKAGLIGSLPILVTALISFGVMGLLNIPLSTTTALLSSIAIGIGIDYAIHFIQNYYVFVKKTNSRHVAIHETMRNTGKAILSNAAVVIAGFLVLLFSVFPPNRILGALVSLNMFTSLLGTLSVMMILIYTSRLFLKHKK
jgi:predicted RND superfamily exporter protein